MFIFTVTFVIIVGNTYVLSTSSTSSMSSISTTEGLTGTEKIIETTTGMPSQESTTGMPSQESTTGMPSQESTTGMSTQESTTGMSTQELTTGMSTQESTTDAMSASEETTTSLYTTTTNATDGATASQTETTKSYTTTTSQDQSTTSKSSLESTTSTLHPPSTSSTSFQTASTSLSSTETSSLETSSSAETSPPSSTAISVTPNVASVTSPTVQGTTTGPTNVTTEKTTTTEETTSDETESTTMGELTSTPESTMTGEPTSTSKDTVPPTTSMTTPNPTTTPENENNKDIILTDDDVIPLSIKVTFKQCMKEKDALANLTVAILKLDECKSVVIGKSEESCDNDTSTTIIFRVHMVAGYLLYDNKTLTIDKILAEINNTGPVNTSEALAFSNIAACDSITCQEAVLKYKEFNCESDGNICRLTSPCGKNACNNQGTCYIKANNTHYLGLCMCTEDDMYTYSGSQCESKTYSWKLWTIVASGVGGGIIVILLFAVVIQCARKKSESFNQKYGYDSGFDDRENLMYDRRYVTSDEYHRKPVPRDDIGADQVNLQSFENKGYDHWEPSESKETYASMDRHFQDPTFHAQITRPKLTTNKYRGDQLTPF